MSVMVPEASALAKLVVTERLLSCVRAQIPVATRTSKRERNLIGSSSKKGFPHQLCGSEIPQNNEPANPILGGGAIPKLVGGERLPSTVTPLLQVVKLRLS